MISRILKWLNNKENIVAAAVVVSFLILFLLTIFLDIIIMCNDKIIKNYY